MAPVRSIIGSDDRPPVEVAYHYLRTCGQRCKRIGGVCFCLSSFPERDRVVRLNGACDCGFLFDCDCCLGTELLVASRHAVFAGTDRRSGRCSRRLNPTNLAGAILNWRNIAISNNVGGVKHVFERTCVSTHQGAPFRSRRWFARFQPGLALNRSGQELGPTQPSLRFRTAIKIRLFELPHLLGAGCPIITSVMDCTPSGFSGSPACEPSFCVWP